jgi:hypothetical protein
MLQIIILSSRKLKYLVTSVIVGVLITVVSASLTNAQEQKNLKLGFLIMAGGRYDNLRMCVATDSGVKGGPIADIMLHRTICIIGKGQYWFQSSGFSSDTLCCCIQDASI